MWELAKRTFPEKALRIITFVNEMELKKYVPEDVLPKGIHPTTLRPYISYIAFCSVAYIWMEY